MIRHAFDFLQVHAREAVKPRTTGLTSIVDFGDTNSKTEEILNLSGQLIDFAKIPGGMPHVFPRERLQTKLALYRQHNVTSYTGGQLFEYTFATNGGQVPREFFDEAKQIGFDAIEISNAYINLPAEVREKYIGVAKETGLKVLVEVGGVDEQLESDALVDDVNRCFKSGADYAIVEGLELIKLGRPRTEAISAIQKGTDINRVLLELPWIGYPGVTQTSIENLKQILIQELGPNVNLANVISEDVLMVESIRCGIECPYTWCG